MGKKGKKLRSDAKKVKKKAEKIRRKAYYESLRASGNNQKSRSARKAKKRKGLGEKGKHLVSNCGNVGCLRCNPVERKPKVFISLRDLLKTIILPKPNLQLVGGNQGYR